MAGLEKRGEHFHLCFRLAAHTGARRSEIVSSLKTDFDFEGRFVLIREKKRVRGRRTTRAVPLSPRLAEVMKGWVADRKRRRTNA